ncbi:MULTISPECIES: hypothetical protein [Halobacteriovorax]|uniref:Uncharacterized protein n=1 Tax=Halobacteriovorax vibrionivorans TaxID=2152716 RepID=A0ABY0IC21_9BACT|nr:MULTISPECIES: hypothetical protein [Halobacteriovorax]AYF44444.1 hypothetical protein BALOs_1443 [Halobacteriovorax sp. BALOs_7]RZF20507.1 hypothetical protein DAY19_11000 [Halobacteriovorax vibrionivorans]TGD47420.1 hypothetical protein EP118_07530 [Halobacteriovorax sp. Y22]
MLIRSFNKILLASLLTLSIQAEYRVYQYMVSSRLQPQGPASVIVTSTLDPNSYVKYNGGNRSIRVNLLKTWMCKGHTGNKMPCKSPLALTAPILESAEQERPGAQNL